ncbi:MAG TPA: bifunctional hydroxymethylpyrimidine kinase/phosphomethylpyrimidine kinase [Candidatus Cloacimonadota bacterium]|nr:bifunctional hydroxymethylpyrimidine kinase/phosphomethylpyrimidine kinase [Candidatus Cloacimonadota bacterium]HPT71710.1 bifunctional hydroxymethylpyrimidine kinase/phosphomethylpyrimidine kinase [Candidatus Cloacimonadota bacterium]
MKEYILTIAALDSSNGAGLTQDARVAYLHHTPLVINSTGITIQTEKGLEAIYPTDTSIFREQLKRTLIAYPVRFIKIGCLCTLGEVEVLLEILPSYTDIPVLLDPVLKPTKGLDFVTEDMMESYLQLLHIIDYISPNWDELSSLSRQHISNYMEAVKAAEVLSEKYNLTVLLKGGHSNTMRIREGLITIEDKRFFTKKRQHWNYSHGTGCALSTAFACRLIHGEEAFSAFRKASLWVSRHFTSLQNL